MLLFNPFEDNVLSFCLIEKDNINIDKWASLSKGQSIVLVEAFDLTKFLTDQGAMVSAMDSPKAAVAIATQVPIAHTHPSSASSDSEEVHKLVMAKCGESIDSTKNKLHADRMLRGFKALLVGTNQIVWISSDDALDLEKNG